MITMFIALGPTIAARKIANVSAGNASQASVIRMITWSTQPPRYPDRIPSTVPRMPAKITAMKPTTSETRGPKMRRERTSRPRWSVPSRCSPVPPSCQAGGWKRSPSVPTSGLWGASTLAKRAVSTNTTMISTGRTGNPSLRKEAYRQASVRAAARLGLAFAALPFIADPRVDDRVEDVHEKVDDDDHRAAQEHDGLDDGEIPEGDPLVEQAADAGPGEDGLDDDRDVDHEDEVDPRERQHGDQRVLERVLGDDERLRQPLDARELHVLRAEDLEHGRARQPHVRGREVPAQRERGHEHVRGRARARGRQPAEVHGEEEDHEEPDPEGREREPEEREELARAVPPAVHPHRRDDARRDPDHEREEHRDRREQEGVGQARAVELEDVGPVVERLAEVAASEVGEEAPVLHPERLVEAELLPDRRQVVGARPGLGEEHGRVAGDAHEDEDRQREEEERDEGEAHALHDESPHGVTARGAWPRSARRRAGLRPSVVGRLMDVLPGREVA